MCSRASCARGPRASARYAGNGVLPPASMMAEAPFAAMACPRRCARAASSAAREGKRRVISVVKRIFLPAARALAHLRPHFEHTPAALAAQHDAGAGLVTGDAPERVLRAARSHPVDGEQQVARLQSRLLSGAPHVQIVDEHSGLGEPPLPRLLVGEVLRNDADPATD